MNKEFTFSELLEIESALIDAIQTYKDFPNRAKEIDEFGVEINYLEFAQSALDKTSAILEEMNEKAMKNYIEQFSKLIG